MHVLFFLDDGNFFTPKMKQITLSEFYTYNCVVRFVGKSVHVSTGPDISSPRLKGLQTSPFME